MLSFSLSIFLESSKCDQFRNQTWIVIARTDLPTCPFKALEDDISEAQISLSEDLLCSWPLLLITSQKKKYEAKKLARQELENSLRMP